MLSVHGHTESKNNKTMGSRILTNMIHNKIGTNINNTEIIDFNLYVAGSPNMVSQLLMLSFTSPDFMM